MCRRCCAPSSARPSWTGAHVALGTNTDPYQWVEGRYKLMRGIWEALRDAANPCSILTKSPLVLRDVDLLREIAARTEVSACFSVPTLDEKAWRASEPRTPHPRARLEAVAELNRAGIPTGILIAPLMPGINDAPEQVERIIALATEAGALHIGGITLHLRGSVRGVFFDWLRGYRPDLVPRYEQLYARGAYVRRARAPSHRGGRGRARPSARPVSRALPLPAGRACAGRVSRSGAGGSGRAAGGGRPRPFGRGSLRAVWGGRLRPLARGSLRPGGGGLRAHPPPGEAVLMPGAQARVPTASRYSSSKRARVGRAAVPLVAERGRAPSSSSASRPLRRAFARAAMVGP